MEFITFGPVHLNVTDLERSIYFYREIVGMQLRKSGIPTEVGTANRTLLVLYPDAKTHVLRGHSGLYHLAIHIPTERELAELLVRMASRRWKIAPTDHIIAKSLYAQDPDGINIEFAVELPSRVAEYKFTDNEFKVIDDRGNIRSPTEPLDVEELFSHLVDKNAGHPLSHGAFIGHMNLHMPVLKPAFDYYKNLGFTGHFLFPNMGWGDLGAGGLVDHRIAVNTWAGLDVPKAPPGTAGLRYFTLNYDSIERFEEAKSKVAGDKADGGYLVEDPGGNQILLST